MATLKTVPDYGFEAQCLAPVAGVDEAGRGPWAGPVVAAAVILNVDFIPAGLNDSKKLTAAQRETAFILIMKTCSVGVGKASTAEIDRLNIRRATHLAMQRAVAALDCKPATLLIDGNDAPDFKCITHTLIKGDGRSLSIAAASIVAKVTRDRIMTRLADEFPYYAWHRNKGYGTTVHHQALKQHGPCPHHRMTFAPIRALLGREQMESD